MNMSKIDNAVSWKTPRIQTSIIDATRPLTLNGYTVALLQMPTKSVQPPPSTPTDIIVDNAAAVFVGTWPTSSATSGYYGTGYRYHWAGTGSNRVTWSFNVTQAGSWEVFAWWTSGSNRATNAPYKVNAASGKTVTVNQEVNGGKWNSLGTFSFNTGTSSVVLSDAANGVVIADAIRLVYEG
jgi:hypothetical protein